MNPCFPNLPHLTRLPRTMFSCFVLQAGSNSKTSSSWLAAPMICFASKTKQKPENLCRHGFVLVLDATKLGKTCKPALAVAPDRRHETHPKPQNPKTSSQVWFWGGFGVSEFFKTRNPGKTTKPSPGYEF